MSQCLNDSMPQCLPFVTFAPLALTLAIANSFSGAIEFMIQVQVRKLRARVAMLALLVLFSVTLTFSQQKEGNPKADAAQKNAPSASDPSAKDDKDKDKDEKNEGDPLFRSIGPFRGGR